MAIVYPWKQNGDPGISATTASKTLLLTLGRLPVGLDIARSFAALGWRVIVAEPFGMHLSRMSRFVDRCYRVVAPNEDSERYLDELLDIVQAESVDLVVPVSEESLHVAALHERLPAGVRLFCAGQDAMLALHDKYRFNVMASSFGLSVPDSCLVTDADRMRITDGNDYVSKPRFSCSGRGVRLHGSGEPPPADAGLMLQQQVVGPLLSSFSIVIDGEVFASTVYRGKVMDGTVAVCFEAVTDASRIHEWIDTFATQSGHTGFLSFDFILDDDGTPFAIECNPRATSGIHFVPQEALAAAVLGTGKLDNPDHQLLTESYSCYTAVLKSLFTASGFREHLASFRAARDVTWMREDPWPFLLMMINTWPIIWGSVRHRQSFAVAAVRDIEWLGRPGSDT